MSTRIRDFPDRIIEAWGGTIIDSGTLVIEGWGGDIDSGSAFIEGWGGLK